MKRVVITGLGVISAAGEGAESLWKAVLDKKSGIRKINFSSGSEPWETMAAEIPDFQPEKFVTQRKSLKVMARDIQLAVAGAGLAMKDSDVQATVFDHERFGVIVGSGVLNHELDELAMSVQSSLGSDGKLDLKKFGDSGLSSLFPLWLLKYLPNMPACHISILFDLQGMNNTLTTGASGGMQAIGEALRIIQRGDADLMLAGGAEAKVNPVGLSEYKILGAFSGKVSPSPEKSYRPFSEASDGFVVGEASAFVVLEELEHAKKRGAKIYAEVAGFGCSYKGGHRIAMAAALKDAKVQASEIDYCQASGVGLQVEDKLEAESISEILGTPQKKATVSGSKPVTGFTGFSAGALDTVVASTAVFRQTVPPMMNTEKSSFDQFFHLNSTASSQKLRNVLVNAFGFNGQTASLVLRKYEN